MTTFVPCACGKRLRIESTLAGRRVQCPRCGQALQVAVDGTATPIVLSDSGSAPQSQAIIAPPALTDGGWSVRFGLVAALLLTLAGLGWIGYTMVFENKERPQASAPATGPTKPEQLLSQLGPTTPEPAKTGPSSVPVVNPPRAPEPATLPRPPVVEEEEPTPKPAAEFPPSRRAVITEEEDAKPRPAAETKPRPRRIERWVLRLPFESGTDYADQLVQLGAAIVIREGDDRFVIHRDLSRRPVQGMPATMQDLKQLHPFYFRDTGVESLEALAREIGLERVPKEIWIFLPQEAEQDLVKKEAQFKGLSEEQIVAQGLQTTFKSKKLRDRWVLEVVEQKARER